VLTPELRDAYDLTLSEIGVVLAAEWVGLLVALLPWGFAADRFGERWTVPTGLAACAACLAGAAYAGPFWALVGLVALAGAAGGSVQSGSGRAVMAWFRPQQRGLALGVRQTAVPVGGVVAALVLPALGTAQAGFLFLACFVLAGALAAAVVLRERGGDMLEAADVEWTLRDRRLWRLSGGSGLYLVAQTALIGFGVLFLHDARGFSEAEAGGVLAVAQVLAAGLRIAAGRWSDVLGARIVPLRRIGLVIVSALALAAALVNAPAPLLVPALAAAAALSMAWNGLSFTAAAELAGRARSGAAIGFQQTALSAVGVVAPIAFAAVLSWTSWRAAFALAALCPLVGWWLLRPLAE
jgi:sugar phosphate permease